MADAPPPPRSQPERPEVLFVINDLGMGGAERVLVSYVNRFQAIRPTVVLLRPALDFAHELAPEIDLATLGAALPENPRAVTAIGRSAPRGRPRGRMLLETPYLAVQVLRLVRMARARGCRMVSTFLNRAHTIALLAKALYPDLRVVINVHEMLSDHLHIHFATLERRIMREFIRRTFPRADAIVAVSEGVRDELVNMFGIARERVFVVHNPLDLARIRGAAAERAEGVEDGRRLIVGVGRLVHLKGFDLLIRAVARLPAELGARLLILGEGPARADLERLVAELGVGDRVELTGALLNPWAVMGRAHVVAVPSRSEAFPTVIGEAMALARPVVAARCSPGVDAYLEGGRSGILVPPDDVDALAAALTSVLSDDALRNRLAEEGRRRVEAFDFPDTVARYEQLMLEVGGDGR
jgi:glycosyltransferase involved in cell wall biosynthesis